VIHKLFLYFLDQILEELKEESEYLVLFEPLLVVSYLPLYPEENKKRSYWLISMNLAVSFMSIALTSLPLLCSLL